MFFACGVGAGGGAAKLEARRPASARLPALQAPEAHFQGRRQVQESPPRVVEIRPRLLEAPAPQGRVRLLRAAPRGAASLHPQGCSLGASLHDRERRRWAPHLPPDLWSTDGGRVRRRGGGAGVSQTQGAQPSRRPSDGPLPGGTHIHRHMNRAPPSPLFRFCGGSVFASLPVPHLSAKVRFLASNRNGEGFYRQKVRFLFVGLFPQTTLLIPVFRSYPTKTSRALIWLRNGTTSGRRVTVVDVFT